MLLCSLSSSLFAPCFPSSLDKSGGAQRRNNAAYIMLATFHHKTMGIMLVTSVPCWSGVARVRRRRSFCYNNISLLHSGGSSVCVCVEKVMEGAKKRRSAQCTVQLSNEKRLCFCCRGSFLVSQAAANRTSSF